ncbi:DUF4249 domain-containing protein [Rufibacter latericius]|uniref:DUF4249 domain-containing protein n=1 Tax=Rufibacter latericius TaxID=2487040 RepID=A0A3M9MNA6_9BACT|nr:DUF4249 domain-containing protein [Rufibacter latericius]RNI26981.1 DUF4249 domain-containing protein [Rufibacter latericius]
MKKYLFLLLYSALLFSSCEEVIEYDLPEDAAKVVIEGLVTDQPGPYSVRLSSSKGYLNQGPSSGFDNAVVRISDNEGFEEILQAKGNGLYQTSQLQGKRGNTYSLRVQLNGQEYTASSYLKPVSTIDSLVYRFKKGNAQVEEGYYGTFYFREPAGKGDLYKFNIYVNGERDKEIIAINDDLYDGNYGDPEIGIELEEGDVMKVEMLSLDRPGYEFFRVLSRMQYYTGGPFDSPPANAPGNISNGALGYFGASAISIIEQKVQNGTIRE